MSRNVEVITEIFNKYDTERRGYIDREQLRQCIFDLNGRNLEDGELNNILDLLDVNKDGKVHLDDFVRTIEQFFRYC